MTTMTKDKDKDKKGFDHFACYDVKCVDRWGKEGPCDNEEELVKLFNQFTYEKGQKVVVKDLKLLCVPTKKNTGRTMTPTGKPVPR